MAAKWWILVAIFIPIGVLAESKLSRVVGSVEELYTCNPATGQICIALYSTPLAGSIKVYRRTGQEKIFVKRFVTNDDGRFTIRLPSGRYSFRFGKELIPQAGRLILINGHDVQVRPNLATKVKFLARRAI